MPPHLFFLLFENGYFFFFVFQEELFLLGEVESVKKLVEMPELYLLHLFLVDFLFDGAGDRTDPFEVVTADHHARVVSPIGQDLLVESVDSHDRVVLDLASVESQSSGQVEQTSADKSRQFSGEVFSEIHEAILLHHSLN